MKILIPYNGSRAARAALAEVTRRPWPAHTRVRIVALARPYPFVVGPETAKLSAPLPDEINSLALDAAQHFMETVLMTLATQRADLSVSAEIRGGELIGAVMAAIADWQPDRVAVSVNSASRSWKQLRKALAARTSCQVEFVGARLAA